MVIWVDPDACPRGAKELIARASARLHLMQHVAPEDLVVTVDIPLANLVVNRGAMGLNPRGEVHTAGSIGERLAVRNLMEELRWAGVEIGGPAAYSPVDRQCSAQALDRLITRRRPAR